MTFYNQAFQAAINIFESKKDAKRWLEEESVALGYISPKSQLNTEEGLAIVTTELNRISHGIVS
jgi:uncharacterized protein (DUF2384 family)